MSGHNSISSIQNRTQSKNLYKNFVQVQLSTKGKKQTANCQSTREKVSDAMVKIDAKNSSGMFKIHNVGFYNLEPRSIKCFSYNKTTSKLAVSRDDASIEIWDMRHAAYMEKCILAQPNASVEALGWLKNRLFSTGLTGDLIEWNLNTMKPKHIKSLTGDSAWCMDIDEANDCIAVGTNKGFLNIFRVDNEDLNFEKLLDQQVRTGSQVGRILCCKYHVSGTFIVTASMDTIRIWNVETGYAMHRMVASRSESKKETIIWSLAVLKDLTIISGDSRGCITVWDGYNGTQIQSITALKADILAVAINNDENMFCCSGIDPIIKMYTLTEIKTENQNTHQWIAYLKRSVHDHDVKALTFVNEKIISGGIDGFIKVSVSVKTSKYNICQYGPFLSPPCAVVAPLPRLLLVKYVKHLELWQLGTPSDNVQLSEESQKQFLSLEKCSEKLVEFLSRRDEPIVCASISPNGMFLIYSTENTVQLFRLDTKIKKPSMSKIKVDSCKFIACTKVLFSTDSTLMYCLQNTGDINIFSLSQNDEIDLQETISTREFIQDTIIIICLSKCGKYLVCAAACGTIIVWFRNKKSWKYYHSLPKFHLPPTAIEIHEENCRMVAAFPDYKILEFDLKEKRITCSSNDNLIQKMQLNSANTVINNILLDRNNENIVILHNDAWLYVLEKEKSFPSKNVKEAKPDETSKEKHDFNYSLKKSIGDYKHFIFLSWLSPSEIVAITVNSVTLIEQLPPPMRQMKFGIS